MVYRHRGVRRVAIIENRAREHSTRILLVEDHASFRQALALAFSLETDMLVVA